MTMALDPNQQRFGPLNLGPLSSYQNHLQFSNPWASQPPHQNLPLPQPTTNVPSLFQQPQHHHSPESHLPNLNLNSDLAKPTPSDTRPSAPSNVSLTSYASLPVTAAAAAAAAGGSHTSDSYRQQQDLLSMPQDLLHMGRLAHPTTSAGYGSTVYTTAPSPVSPSFPSSSAGFGHIGYTAAPSRSGFAMSDLNSSRRYPQQSPLLDDRRSFQDALEASQGMLSMSQETPRNIYDVRNRQRGSVDSYGFPLAHSTESHMSSSSFSGYYPGSVDGSVSDYSTAGSDIEPMSGRTTLPRLQPPMPAPHPHQHQHEAHQQQPPAPQSMMGSFSSKISSSAQKKHKCKVCDKRFTRPSSLQTHMYSHTGEKPFACPVPGCGRQFSVVSNLRRHRKVHKGTDDQELDSASQDAGTPSEAGSEEQGSEEHQSD